MNNTQIDLQNNGYESTKKHINGQFQSQKIGSVIQEIQSCTTQMNQAQNDSQDIQMSTTDDAGNDLFNMNSLDEHDIRINHQVLIQSQDQQKDINIKNLTEKVAIVLQNLAQIGDQITTEDTQSDATSTAGYISPFESNEAPEICAGLYFLIIIEKIRMPEQHTIAVLALLNRIANMTTNDDKRIYSFDGVSITPEQSSCLKINSFTIHRLVLVTILIVHKYFTDQFYLNSYFAQIGGIEAAELNYLEREFLEIIDFRLSIDVNEYENYSSSLTDYFKAPLKPEIIEIKASIDKQIDDQSQMLNQEQEQFETPLTPQTEMSEDEKLVVRNREMMILQQIQYAQQIEQIQKQEALQRLSLQVKVQQQMQCQMNPPMIIQAQIAQAQILMASQQLQQYNNLYAGAQYNPGIPLQMQLSQQQINQLQLEQLLIQQQFGFQNDISQHQMNMIPGANQLQNNQYIARQ